MSERGQGANSVLLVAVSVLALAVAGVVVAGLWLCGVFERAVPAEPPTREAE